MKDHLLPDTAQVRVRQSFRRGLGTYHQAASAQARIAEDLAGMLRACGAPRQLGAVLEFGCGTGHLTQALLQRFAVHDLTLNDLVTEAAGPTCSAAVANGILPQFVSGPVETVALPQELDLIASASTVQWVSGLPAVLERLCNALRPGGWLALSGFGAAQFRELAALGSDASAPNYMNAGDWPGALPRGMELLAIRQEPIVLEFASAIGVLRHLRATGVNGKASQHWGRGRLRAFETAYRERFCRNGLLPLTYDPVVLVARKK